MLFLALVPTSLFLGAVYSESLFLLLALASFLLAERGRFWRRGRRRRTRAPDPLGRYRAPAGARLLAWRAPDRKRALAGVAVVPLAVRALPPHCSPSGSAIRSRSSMRRRASGSGASRLAARSAGSSRRCSSTRCDLAVAAALLALAVVAWRRFGAAYGLYALTSVTLPLSFVSDTEPLWSIPRFALVVFPIFMALAAIARATRATLATAAFSPPGSPCIGQMGAVVLGRLRRTRSPAPA